MDTRRALHRRPELAFCEHATAALVAERLRALGLQPRTGIGGTGVIADLEGAHPGQTLLLRAELDALPLDELDGRSYGSELAGRMHACGHDAHMSALLGAAELLVSRRDRLAGRVRFLFQPAEEIGAGAQAMIEDGALEAVDEALGAHVFTPLPFGVAATREGELLVGADLFELVVSGGGGHSGLSHDARDAVFAAAQLVGGLQSIVARETSPTELLSLAIASVEGGSAANVVASEVTLRGTLRWLKRSEREHALGRVEQIAAGVCGALRVAHELRITATLPVMHGAPEPTALLADAARAAGATVVDPGILPASDDCAYIAERVPSAFIAIGAGGEGCGAHHALDFDIDERSIGLSAEILARATLARLGQGGAT
ncbi:MAG: amidohydrolase [Actinomycetota bacterium]|nr:amidohydrolase [Actinomycetota bacterium]